VEIGEVDVRGERRKGEHWIEVRGLPAHREGEVFELPENITSSFL